MKKNISINIGGIIFHIEEDGYERLRSYLDSINRYFATFEDSKEIIDDIENRIAEILLGKLTDGKQVVNIADINELVATMGTVADFEATIESEPSQEKTEEKAPEEEEYKESKSTDPKKLYRNTQRRVIGGVASGLAYYFSIDPIWIRLLILALFFNVFFWGLSGLTLLAYIILWIVVPGNDQLEDDKKVKKLFRNSEDRVLGGVAGGIASYFGTDTTVIRLLFVISIFAGGAGILLYIILWIITPEARSITEKMQMQGEPVTLSNIESNVKKSLNVKEGEESVFVKILLFPFRLIALIIGFLGEVLGPFLKFLVEAIRIVFGAIVILLGFSLMFSFFITSIIFLGAGGYWTEFVYLDEIPVEMLTSLFNPFAAIAFFLLTFIPALALTLLGFVIILKRKVGNAYFGWALFGFWVIGLIASAYYIPSFVKEFRSDATHRTETVFEKATADAIPTLKLNYNENLGDWDGVSLKLRGHSDSTFKVVTIAEANGPSRNEALENARAISYNVIRDGNDFVFDEELSLNGQPFRFQEVDVIFYIPFGQKFKMDKELDEILRNTLHLNGYRTYQMDGNEWIFDRSGINCLTCEEKRSRRRNYTGSSIDTDTDWDNLSGEKRTFDFNNDEYDNVLVSSLINVKVVKANEYSVELYGDEDDLEEVYINSRRNQLEIEYKRDLNWLRDRDIEIYAIIRTPELKSIELIGGCTGEMEGFSGDKIEISLTGASDMTADVDVDILDVNLTGASKLSLSGTGNLIDAKIVGASKLEAFEFRASDGNLEVLGASSAYIYASDDLEIDAAGASTVRYRGDARIDSNSSGFSSVRKE